MKPTRAGNLSKAQRFAQFHGGGIAYLFSQLNDLYFFATGKIDGRGLITDAEFQTASEDFRCARHAGKRASTDDLTRPLIRAGGILASGLSIDRAR